MPQLKNNIETRKAGGIEVKGFQVARDLRSGRESAINPESLRAGQNIVIQGGLTGLRYVKSDGKHRSQIGYHIELRTAGNQVVVQTSRRHAKEVVLTPDGTRPFAEWLTIPSNLQPGKYHLTLQIQDEVSQVATVADLPIRVY